MRAKVIGMAAALLAASCAANEAAERRAPAVAAPAEVPAAAPPAPEVALVARLPREPARALAADDGGNWALVREFPVPDYSQPHDGPRTDFRETVFWAPAVSTGDDGVAELSFYLSDAITTFRASAEGVAAGAAGRGELDLVSSLPVSLSARLPVAVTVGDKLLVPVTITNTTGRPVRTAIESHFGDAFAVIDGAPARRVRLRPGQARTLRYALRVVDAAGDTTVRLAAGADGLRDELERTVRVVPRGFPVDESLAGTLRDRARHVVRVPGDAASLRASLRLYPSPVSSMLAGTEALLREPVGCFEQASSSNYPNVMVLRYLGEQGEAAPALAAGARGMLDRGYQKLRGYESESDGFEWFGGDPGHEALSAYGLLQFTAMAEVFPEVDAAMVERTARWLESRRDGRGGYRRSDRALDSFGRASEEVTNAYITYALLRAGRRGLDAEVEALRRLAAYARDPYLLALAAGGLFALDPADADGERALARILAQQDESGRVAGADHSITRSGGAALDIETTALAALAMSASASPHAAAHGRALDWIRSQRSGLGAFASTQATVLALEALTSGAGAGALPEDAAVEVWINGERVRVVEAVAAGDDGAITVDDLGAHLRPGDNVIALRARGDLELPYSIGVAYQRHDPPTSARAPVALTTRLSRRSPRLGQSVRLTATVENTRSEGLPMVVARVGIPGGLDSQTWQLDELRERGVVDFYETGEREVILYWRQMAPGARHEVPIELLATTGGRFAGPPSAAYLYYTGEHRHWTGPLTVGVRPRFHAEETRR